MKVITIASILFLVSSSNVQKEKSKEETRQVKNEKAMFIIDVKENNQFNKAIAEKLKYKIMTEEICEDLENKLRKNE